MQLSLHSEYALRVLLYLGACPDCVVSTEEISTAYGISRNHLVRVIQTLGEDGCVRVVPGRFGGVSLGKDPGRIRIGDVVRHAEPNFRMAECFDPQANACVITPVCSLKPVLSEALNSFLAALNRYSLADLLAGGTREKMARKLVTISGVSTGAES